MEKEERVAPEDQLVDQISVITGLAVGDSLGSTSEFEIPWEVGKNCVAHYPGWPGCQVGQGRFKLAPGSPTDDTQMGMAILRSIVEIGAFSEHDIAQRFVQWMKSGPKDIGMTTSGALRRYKPQRKFYLGAKEQMGRMQGPKTNAANGSLMRNGVIPALYCDPKAYSDDFVISATVGQGLITHFGPLSVLVCVLQSLIIREAFRSRYWPSYGLNNTKNKKKEEKDEKDEKDEKVVEGERQDSKSDKLVEDGWKDYHLRPVTMSDIKYFLKDKSGPWQVYKRTTKYNAFIEWKNSIGEQTLKDAEAILLEELAGFETFDPYTQDYRGRSGYGVLTLKIALWGLFWSFPQQNQLKIPDWLPAWPFEKRGFNAIMYIVLIGADADTYGASAGPILAAYHSHIPDDLKSKLRVSEEITALVKKLQVAELAKKIDEIY